MRVLYGMYPADEGRILGPRRGGQIASPRDAHRAGDRDGPPAFRAGRPVHRGREHHPRSGGRPRSSTCDAAAHRRSPSSRRVRVPGRPERCGGGPLRRPAAAGRDPEGAVPGGRRADPRRAHGGPDPARGGGAVRQPASSPRCGEGGGVHQPQAGRGAGHRATGSRCFAGARWSARRRRRRPRRSSSRR